MEKLSTCEKPTVYGIPAPPLLENDDVCELV